MKMLAASKPARENQKGQSPGLCARFISWWVCWRKFLYAQPSGSQRAVICWAHCVAEGRSESKTPQDFPTGIA